MTHDSLEIVRQALKELRHSYARGAATEGLLDLCAPDIRVDATRRVFNPGLYEGHVGLRRLIGEISDDWEDFHATDERMIDLGERVAVIQTIGGRGRLSKIQVEQRGALVWTVRQGLVQHVEVVSDYEGALAALGLTE
jgi:hypothetical protein